MIKYAKTENNVEFAFTEATTKVMKISDFKCEAVLRNAVLDEHRPRALSHFGTSLKPADAFCTRFQCRHRPSAIMRAEIEDTRTVEQVSIVSDELVVTLV